MPDTAAKHVLLVDDEPKVATVLAKVLTSLEEAYTVDVAHSGEEALSKLHQQPYQLIISDQEMPQMTGTELAQFARAIVPEVGIVLMTEQPTTDIAEKAEKFNFSSFIRKPFTRTQFVSAVRRSLKQHRNGMGDTLARGQFTDWEVKERLHQLHENTNAQCVVLLNSGGFPLEIVGETEGLDVQGVGVLAVATCAVFNSNYHEGDRYNVYSRQVMHKLFIVVFFEAVKSIPEKVRFLADQTAERLAPLVDTYLSERTSRPQTGPQLVSKDFAEDFSAALDDVLPDEDDFFASEPINGDSIIKIDPNEVDPEANTFSFVVNGVRISVAPNTEDA